MSVGINVVIITTKSRPSLLYQTLQSLHENSTQPHYVTLVFDGFSFLPSALVVGVNRVVVNVKPAGASASRNSGAGSLPRYRRGTHVMFADDDLYFTPGWDERLAECARAFPRAIWSGYGHPFNLEAERPGCTYARFPSVISTTAMMMSWEAWDRFGPFNEPGGPGGSEDVALCRRAAVEGYEFVVTAPHSIIHTGLRSSSGRTIVGYDALRAQNERLLAIHGLEGKVRFED